MSVEEFLTELERETSMSQEQTPKEIEYKTQKNRCEKCGYDGVNGWLLSNPPKCPECWNNNKQKDNKGVCVNICPIHGNYKYNIEPTHYCKYKIREACNCVCSCKRQKDNKVEWEEEFDKLWKKHIDWVGSGFRYNDASYTAKGMDIGKRELKSFITSLLNQRDTELKEKIEKHHLAELEELKNSNNQETTKEYIKKGFEVYKTQLI